MNTIYLHPDHKSSYDSWGKYRSAYEGGTNFMDLYLEEYSARETPTDYTNRKKYTYSPSHAKRAINEVKNSISSRFKDIIRSKGPQSYLDACDGKNKGVDRQRRTMNDFIGSILLPELLVMGKVGVFVDRLQRNMTTKADSHDNQPYLYYYRAEDILTWSKDEDGDLTALLLKDTTLVQEDMYGLTTSNINTYRLLQRLVDPDTGLTFVRVSVFQDMTAESLPLYQLDLEIKEIPFVIFELRESLMTDVADMQIALLNIESSDIDYIIKANFPFYVEQKAGQDLLATALNGSSSDTADLGTRQGRTYPKGYDAPSFIYPSPEPLLAAMKKEEQIKDDIKQLVSLSVTNLSSSSAESKLQNDKSLDAGLAAIGSIIAYGERLIAHYWAMYEGEDATVIKYPTDYSLKTEDDRLKESDSLLEKRDKVPSKTYQKEISKEVARLVLSGKVSQETLDTIDKEISSSKVVVTNHEIVKSDHEIGLVSTELASEIRGYPKGQVAIAKIEHAERLARIAAAQSSVPTDIVDNPGANAGARGIVDQGESTDGKEEKTASRDTTNDSVIKDKTRGTAK